MGQEVVRIFHNLETTPPLPTSWINFPTDEEPSNMFKYASFKLELSQDVVEWQRSTYSILDFMGDLGGLFDSLRLIG